MNIFEQATRQKVRFETPKGNVTTEDLWDLPLTSNTGKANLDDIAIELSAHLKTDNVSFVNKNRAADPELQLKFDVIKSIIETRLTEQAAAKTAKERSEKKQQLLAIIADKENEQLKNTPVDQLRAMVDAL